MAQELLVRGKCPEAGIAAAPAMRAGNAADCRALEAVGPPVRSTAANRAVVAPPTL